MHKKHKQQHSPLWLNQIFSVQEYNTQNLVEELK